MALTTRSMFDPFYDPFFDTAGYGDIFNPGGLFDTGVSTGFGPGLGFGAFQGRGNPGFGGNLAGQVGDYGMRGADISRVIPRHVGSRVLTDEQGNTIWRPAADIYESDDNNLVVHIDIPGVPKDDINIEVKDGDLYVTGERKRGEGFEAASSRVRERNIGKFRKIVRIPAEYDTDKIQAKDEYGLLEIKIPKKEGVSKTSRVAIA